MTDRADNLVAGAARGTLPPDFAEAVRLHESGHLDEAAARYDRILAARPEDPRALNLRGVVALQQGKFDDAHRYLARAVALVPDSIDYRMHLGETHRLAGRHGQALACYHACLAADPKLATAYFNCAIVLSKLHRYAEAADAAETARQLEPGQPEFAFRHGVILVHFKDMLAAKHAFRRVIALDPRHAEAHFNLGVVLEAQQDEPGAARAYHRAIRLKPDHIGALNNLAALMQRNERYRTARVLFDKVLALSPRDSRLINNLGTLLMDDGDIAGAERVTREALDLDPGSVPGHTNLGTILMGQGRVYEGLSHFREAVRLQPDAENHTNLGLALMLVGQLEEGCRENGWRWRSSKFETPNRPFRQPGWNGEDLAGKILLYWGEQGVGDEIMLAGLVPKLRARGARVLIETEKRLVPLFRRSFPDVECFARDYARPPARKLTSDEVDYQVPMCSAVGHVAPDPEGLRVARPYLVADPDKVAGFRRRYDALGPGLKVGIAWFSVNKKRAQRIAPLTLWGPILEQPGIRLFDLQYGNRKDEREAAMEKFGVDIFHDDSVDSWKDLDGFAAQVAALDLVISISNTTVHTAGSLGVECWTMLPTMPDWRWFLDRDWTPWYPDMRLFRQRRLDDWADVIARVAAELERKVAGEATVTLDAPNGGRE